MYAGLKEYFETLGWEVQAAQDVGLKGAKDKDIVEYAQEHDFLLVTQDQKPAELAELKGVKHVAKIADQEIRKKYPNVDNE
jgi:predicted nuclease of predicted toxin-antitoxin system